MSKKPVQSGCPKKVISTWHLPNSGERIALEVVKDMDGYDRPQYDFGDLAWELFSETHVGPLEDDQEYFFSVIVPQGRQVMNNYFYRRALLNTSIEKRLKEHARRSTKMIKPSKVKQ